MANKAINSNSTSLNINPFYAEPEVSKLTNGKRDRNSKNQPEQLWPFPMFPGLQLQLKDPSALVQVAFSLQL